VEHAQRREAAGVAALLFPGLHGAELHASLAQRLAVLEAASHQIVRAVLDVQ
jgi:hypothetical protein